MLTTLMINNYKKNFLNVLKEDIKSELKDYQLEEMGEINLEESQENAQN